MNYLNSCRILTRFSLFARSDGILLIGSDERNYTASKKYPAPMSGTAYLAFFNDKISAPEVLLAAAGGAALSFDGAGSLSDLTPALTEGLQRLVTCAESFGSANKAVYAD